MVDTLECCHCLELWVFERNLFPLCQYLRYKKQKLLLSFIQSTFHLQLHFVNVVPTSTVPAEEAFDYSHRNVWHFREMPAACVYPTDHIESPEYNSFVSSKTILK